MSDKDKNIKMDELIYKKIYNLEWLYSKENGCYTY